MTVYVLESTLLSQDDGSDETRVILGIFSSIAKADEAIDIAKEKGRWDHFTIRSKVLDDASLYL